MRENRFFSVRAVFLLTAVLVVGAPLAGEVRQEQNKRPMEFMDIMGMREAGAPDFSHDSKWALYTLSNIDWEENKNFTDLYLTSIETGEVRQLTFTADKNERSPEWSPAGGYFAFLSDREGKKTQLYFMRQGGGEAWRVTDQKDGVGSFRFSEDGN
ncbi:MAG: PD40 domain-containing protein, partial [Acidobacteria bacterium]|nr:PD40 domain-containing protein [Acidobacteriota bacterium]